MKGLEALKRIALKDFILNDDSSVNDIKIIEKELKTLEILKESIDLSYDKYRNYITLKNHEVSLVLTKERCDLLKEVLKK